MSLVIVDYGSGNVASVLNMVRREGGSAALASDPADVLAASKLILPGVGAFDHGVKQLQSLGLFGAIQERVARGAPMLGICLGMQLLGNRSEEGDAVGLGLIDADFRRFSFDTGQPLRVPHVGWNQVRTTRENALIPSDGSEQRFYFTHSYHAVCAREEDTIATTDYGYPFAAAYNRANIYGVQFHPEKSHRFGRALILRFLTL